jgi:hypothetical protein
MTDAPHNESKISDKAGAKGVTFDLGPTGAMHLYGAPNEESKNQGFKQSRDLSAKRLFYSPPGAGSNEKSSSSSKCEAVGSGSSASKYGGSILERHKSSDAASFLGSTNRHMRSLTKGGTKIFQSKLFDINEEPSNLMAATPFNPH